MSLLAAPAPSSTEEDPDVALHIRDLVKTYPSSDNPVPAVDDTTLDIARGEFLVLLGPSGCGKSTFLRCIAGLEHPDAGVIESLGRSWFSSDDKILVPPERRDLSMIFQSYALWPHMTIFKNVAYPLTVGRDKASRDEVKERVHEALRLVGIENLADRYPAQISGGQQQRVALARALVRGSEIVLFDEPLSNVDARVRDHLRAEIRAMQQRLGFTAIYVTHDQEEALAIADRIAVIDHGKVLQVGTPREVYLGPATLRVARFVGKINEVPGTLVGTDEAGHHVVDTVHGRLVAENAEEGLEIGDELVVAWRPDRVDINHADGDNAFDATVVESHFLGSFTEVELDTGHGTMTAYSMRDDRMEPGERCTVSVTAKDLRLLKKL